jgi:putative addiction module component (TIGR02574 family)
MLKTHNRVIEEALSLPTDIRLSLIEKLLMSLNRPVDEENDLLWADEVERRISQVEEGKVKLVSGEEVFAKIRGKHRK